MLAQILDGHITLADWLFLIAAILFVVGAVGSVLASVHGTYVEFLKGIGFALIALGWLVL